MEISVSSQPPTSKIIYELNEEFHQYQPPPNRILCSVSNKYNVFLSFRGKDVRTTFVDHLYEALCGAGLRVFLDSEELEKGKEIESSLESAIATSDIFIPVFSRNYAESTWCLKEAARMWRCNGFIIPLFYDVEPCDVRYPQRKGGPFEDAFQKHYRNLDRQVEGTIEEWKIALYKISSLSGWTRAGQFGYEGRLAKRVVKDVLDTLKITLLDVPEHLVGLQTNMYNLIKSLDLSSWHRTVKVGVIGIGGVGKTTLAKAVYNTIYTGFDAHCYAKRNTTLVDLQREILRSLVNYQGEVSSVDGGKALMRNRLRGVRALVILDDVNDGCHLDAVNGNWFGQGSRIIITSRDRHILSLAKVDSVLQMSGLGDDDALELFSWHAFSRAVPQTPYQHLSTEIARACRGHPLSVQVIGAHLFDKKEPSDIKCWEEALNNIGENQEITSVLRISYDELSHVEKEIFLDIACCCAGERETDAVIFWEVLHPNRVQTALKNLKLKMLIAINKSGPEYGVLEMHDLLRGIGRGIQRQLDNNSRLWLPMDALNRARLEVVNMLVLTEESGRGPLSLHSMPSLRYLVLQNTKVAGNIGNLVPNLLWIRIRHCDLNDTYAWLRLRNGFQIDGSWSQVRILSVEQCASLTRIPKTVDSLVNLQCFYLNDCVALTALPNALGNLSQLQELYLGGCSNLTSLPGTLGNLTQLKNLDLQFCTGLRSLPTSLGNLTQLECLDLAGCTGLRNLPNTVGNLANLRLLFMEDCSGLQSLPYAVGKLRNLRVLFIFDSTVCWGDIRRFHDRVFKLAQLRDSNRSDGLGRLAEKKYNVCIVCHAADAEEALKGADKYKYLRSGSTRICRVSEDEENSREIKEAIDNSDILVPILTQNFAESIMCAREYSAILSSDAIIVPLHLPNYWSSWYSFWELLRKVRRGLF